MPGAAVEAEGAVVPGAAVEPGAAVGLALAVGAVVPAPPVLAEALDGAVLVDVLEGVAPGVVAGVPLAEPPVADVPPCEQAAAAVRASAPSARRRVRAAGRVTRAR